MYIRKQKFETIRILVIRDTTRNFQKSQSWHRCQKNLFCIITIPIFFNKLVKKEIVQ